jgi:hypothetical protein
LILVLLAGGAAFILARMLGTPSAETDELTWLVNEFELTAEQAAVIRDLHESYRPVCDRHCEAIRQTHGKLQQASSPAAQAAVEAELAELQQLCHTSTQAHLRQVAAAMSPEQAQRYLELIEPRLSSHQHDEPFGLR